MSKKLGNVISSIILIILLLAVGVFIAPRMFGITPMVVLSGSMEPTYPVGSLIFVEKVDPATLSKDDNVSFTLGQSETVVTHRVVENNVETKQITTKGDANQSEDASPAGYSNVIGKAKNFAIPFLGFVGVFINSTAGYIVLGTLFVVLVIISFLSDKKKGGNHNE